MLVHNENKIYNGQTQILKVYQGTSIIYEYYVPSSVKIYGIKREISSSSPLWERLNDAIGLVANATHDGTSVVNDFDTLYPWSDIISYNYDVSNDTITAYYGDNDFAFDGTNGEVLTKIPEFWYLRYQENGWEYVYIADGEVEGFTKSDEFSEARFLMSGSANNVHSKSGVEPYTSINIGTARNSVKNSLHDKFCLLDYHYFIIQLLYLVEYASYNSQEKLGVGIQSGSRRRQTGGCNFLGMKSGSLNQDGYNSVIYRGIEDVFGNVFQTLDGLYQTNSGTLISYNPTNYGNTSQYTNTSLVLGYHGTNWPVTETLTYDADNPLIQLPLVASSSSTDYSTYITDSSLATNSDKIIQAGGSAYYNRGQIGLWCYAVWNSTSSAYADMGYRFIKYK